MSGSIADELREVIGEYIERPPALIAEEVRDAYPGITLQDAQRIRDGLAGVLTAQTPKERGRAEKEYKDLHRELKRKYRKSGR